MCLIDISRQYFFVWSYAKESLGKFLDDFHKFHPNIKFAYESVKLLNDSITTDLHITKRLMIIVKL